MVAADEAKANDAAAAAQNIKDECESELAEAIPALEASIAALNTLKPSDITEVKTMKVSAGRSCVSSHFCLFTFVSSQYIHSCVLLHIN